MSYVEKRDAARISCHLYASMNSRGKTYNGFIENISENGLKYLLDALIIYPTDFSSHERIKLFLPIFSDELINLDCEVKWFLRVSPEDDTLIGMRIINPPDRYKELIKNVYLTRYL